MFFAHALLKVLQGLGQQGGGREGSSEGGFARFQGVHLFFEGLALFSQSLPFLLVHFDGSAQIPFFNQKPA